MQNEIKIGQVIAGKYELIKALKKSHLYQYIEGVNLKTQKFHIIQVLLNNCQTGQIKEAFDYFDDLKNVRREGIIPPEQVISSKDLPLVIIYPESLGSVLDFSKNLDLELILKYLSEASELLHILNNKKLIHGQINPKSFILKDDKVYLSRFGYASFLTQGNEDALKDCGDFLPPEISDANSAQKSRETIDTYAFAKTLAYWFPNIADSGWYLQATNPDPNQRFKRMRNLFRELKKALTDMLSETVPVDQSSSTKTEIPAIEIKLEPKFSGGIVPKYLVEVEVDPPEAGRVEGGGKYIEDKQIKLEAIAFSDWEFVGWHGDIIQSDKSLDMIVKKNVKVIAKYKRLPNSFASIQVEIFPLEAKEFVKVSGVGNHLLNTNVSIHAWSIYPENWCFVGWEGDINSSSNPLTIHIDTDKKITGRFENIPNFTDSKRKKNIQPGSAFSSNEEIEVTPSELSSQIKTRQVIGEAFNLNSSQQVIQQESLEQSQPQRVLGKAFASYENDESSSTES